MKKSDRTIFLAAFALLCLSIAGQSLSAAPLRAALRATSIAVGEKAVVSGQSAPGGRITVQVTGPASIPPGNATANAAGNYSLELGPFTAPGSYGLYVRSGIEQQLLVLEVQERMAAGALREAANGYIQAVNRMKRAMQGSVDRLSAQLGQFPPGDPYISAAVRELPRLRTLFFEVYRVTDDIVNLTEPLVFDLCEVQGLQTEAVGEVGRFYNEGAQMLNPAAEALEGESREEAGSNASDWCQRMVTIKKGVFLLSSALKIHFGGFQHYLIETVAAGSGAGALSWFQEHFMERLPGGMRPLTETQEHNVHLAHMGIEAAIPFILEGGRAHLKPSIISICEGAISSRIDGWIEHHCQAFRGRISGHVHVEALENGNAFYAQDNDWTGQVTLVGSQPAGDAPVSVSGSIIGRAKNFKADNRLYVIYGKEVSQKVFFTIPPSPFRQAFALFYAKLEGTIRAGTLTIKHVSTTFDGVRNLEARLVAIVVPFGSPIPVLHKFDLPFQGANFQLSRCFGPAGVSFPIEMVVEGAETLRRVRGTSSRNLSNAGARGTFKIKVDLCSSCPEGWQGEE